MIAHIILAMLIALPHITFSQSRILHYTETSGYDHQTRAVSYDMFVRLGNDLGFTVVNDSTGLEFNDFQNLMLYDVIVFSNTSGDQILDAAQRLNFESYIQQGGNFIGIHSASDTYRHSSANGSNTGAWDWYAEMIGASVRQNPNHVSGTPFYNIHHVVSHPILNGIPDPWFKAEEYYYWEGGYYDSSNIVLLKVEQTLGPNMQVNSYDSSRAVCWYRLIPGAGRVFYTSLGHSTLNFTSDSLFYLLIKNALLWAGATNGIAEHNEFNKPILFPNPCKDYFQLYNVLSAGVSCIQIFDLKGREMMKVYRAGNMNRVGVHDLHPGAYILMLEEDDRKSYFRFMKK